MTLTWSLDAHAEPDPSSWAAMLPPGGIKEKSSAENIDNTNTPRGAVFAALKDGYITVAAIADKTGQTTAQVGFQLTVLRQRGEIVASGRGRYTTWALCR